MCQNLHQRRCMGVRNSWLIFCSPPTLVFYNGSMWHLEVGWIAWANMRKNKVMGMMSVIIKANNPKLSVYNLKSLSKKKKTQLETCSSKLKGNDFCRSITSIRFLRICKKNCVPKYLWLTDISGYFIPKLWRLLTVNIFRFQGNH